MSYVLELLLEALDPEELDDDPEELELELEALEAELPEELELEELGALIFGAPGSGLVPHPNRETQRHNKATYFITGLRRERLN